MAASNSHFYEDTFNKLGGMLSTYINDVASNVIGAITPVATTLVTIYVMLWGWSMMRGVISEPVMDGFSRIVRISIITAIALNLGMYNNFLSDMLWQSPDALAGYIASQSNSTAPTNAQFLDQIWSQIYDLGDAYWQKAYASVAGVAIPIPHFGLLIIAILIWVAGIAATAFGAFLLVMSKIALAIILGIGPLFILMTLFEPTKRFFDAWLGQALNYVFLLVLTAAAIRLLMTIIQAYLFAAQGHGVLADPSVSQAIPAIVLCVICALVMAQLNSIASALGGGVAIGTLGAVGYAFGKARGGAGSGRDLMTGKTLSDMRGARRAKMNNAKWAANNPGMTKKMAGAPMAVYRKVTGGNKNKVERG